MEPLEMRFIRDKRTHSASTHLSSRALRIKQNRSLKEHFTQRGYIRHYLLTAMSVESQVTFCSTQNISQQNSVLAFSFNNGEVGGDLF